MDPYAVLGVAVFATDAELVRAFRRLALLHHPDRNGGSEESAARFREIKLAYDKLRALRAAAPASAPAGAHRPSPPAPRPSPPVRRAPSREIEPESVTRVRRRLQTLDAAIRTALADGSASSMAAVVDAARWARLDVDTSLAMKGHVADLRDEHWARMTFTTRATAIASLNEFVGEPITRLDLVGMRNLRARLTGVLALGRGLSDA